MSEQIPDWLRHDLAEAVRYGDTQRVKELTRHAAALVEQKKATERK